VPEKSMALTSWKDMNLKAGIKKHEFILLMSRKEVLWGSTNLKLNGAFLLILGYGWNRGITLFLISLLVLSSPSRLPGGILLPTTLTKVILVFRAFSKCCFKKGFLRRMPSKIRVSKHLFLAIASARVTRLPSSLRSLFLEMSSLVIPVFFPTSEANISKPLSLKLLRPISSVSRVVFLSKN
jgi:hypothetical protein